MKEPRLQGQEVSALAQVCTSALLTLTRTENSETLSSRLLCRNYGNLGPLTKILETITWRILGWIDS